MHICPQELFVVGAVIVAVRVSWWWAKAKIRNAMWWL